MESWYVAPLGGPTGGVSPGHGPGDIPFSHRRRRHPAVRRLGLGPGDRHPDDRPDPDDRRHPRPADLAPHDGPVGPGPPPGRGRGAPRRRPARSVPRPVRLTTRARFPLPWLRFAAVTAVRDARADETSKLGHLLARAGFGPTVGGLVTFPRESPHGDVLVAERGGRPVGGVCCASFGTSGWIGALGVVPEARRRGVGLALAEAACDRLRERGAHTVLLFATDMGHPLY